MEVANDVLVVLGATASGKSSLAMALAQVVGAEILSVDSMQVYRHMDIGTAKPTAAEQALVKHHGIDLVEANESYTAALFVEMADGVIADAAARGVPLIITGGTPLYYKVLFEGMFEGPAADVALREKLTGLGNVEMHRRLSAVDPVSARRIHVNDMRRLIRALEVYELTGKPIGQLQQQWIEPMKPQGMGGRDVTRYPDAAHLPDNVKSTAVTRTTGDGGDAERGGTLPHTADQRAGHISDASRAGDGTTAGRVGDSPEASGESHDEAAGQPAAGSRQMRHAATWFGLNWDRDQLNKRINARVKMMLQQGWIEETAELVTRYGALSPTAGEATGYAVLIDHLAGRISLDDATEQIKISTRQLARRQMKWIRRFPNVTWLDGESSIESQMAAIGKVWPVAGGGG